MSPLAQVSNVPGAIQLRSQRTHSVTREGFLLPPEAEPPRHVQMSLQGVKSRVQRESNLGMRRF